MVQATFIDASEASKPKRSDSRRDGRMKDYDAFIATVIANAPQVAKVTPEGNTVRAERLRVAQAISRYTKANKPDGKLESWTGQDGSVLVRFTPATNGTNGSAPTEATDAPAPEATMPPARRAK